MQRWPARLWLVRHGESAGNLAGRSASVGGLLRIEIEQRDADVPLSTLGAQQADALGDWWAGNDPTDWPEVLLASPYLRAQQTAERICAALRPLGHDLRPVLDERFRERELGMLDGLTRAGVAELMPEQAALRTRLGKFYYRPPGGESWCDVILRLRSALDTISLHYPERQVLIVCHQAVVLCLRYLLEELDERELLAIDAGEPVANCSVTEYELTPVRDELPAGIRSRNGSLPGPGPRGPSPLRPSSLGPSRLGPSSLGPSSSDRSPAGVSSRNVPRSGMSLKRFNFVVPLKQEGVAVTAEPPKSDET